MDSLIKFFKRRVGMHWHYLIVIGFLWGLSEVILNIFFRSVIKISFGGSILAGLAFFFICWAYRLTGKISSIFVILAMVVPIKLLSAFFMGLPIMHGSIINPIYAYFTQVGAFLLFIVPMNKKFGIGITKNAIGGAVSGFSAAMLFPLVKYFTGVPACVVVGTMIPVAFKYSPLTAAIAALVVPLASFIEAKLSLKIAKSNKSYLPLAFDTVSVVALATIILLQV